MQPYDCFRVSLKTIYRSNKTDVMDLLKVCLILFKKLIRMSSAKYETSLIPVQLAEALASRRCT